MRRGFLAIATIGVFFLSGIQAWADSEAPIWYDEDGYTRAGKRALALLATSDEHGISLERYGYTSLNAAKGNANAKKINGQVTESVILYLLDLKYGVMGKKDIISKAKGKTAADRRKYFADVLEVIANKRSPNRVIRQYVAEGDEYWDLKESLEYFKELGMDGDAAKIKITKSIKLNDQNEAIPLIRKKLVIVESYNKPSLIRKVSKSDVYDEALQNQIKEFQANAGLKADGIIGRQTAAKLNNQIEFAIAQIKFSMDKIRADDSVQSAKQVIINIPAFELQAYKDGKKKFTMPVIVGKKYRKTPEFNNYVNRVVFNPEWRPTARIKREDILPKVRKNPNYLVNGGYRVMWRDSGKKIASNDLSQIDWGSVSHHDVDIVQSKGSSNALGVVKFLLPDNDSVYLHDTNKRELFAKSYRALSSGCIRLSNPLQFAEFVFDGDSIDGKSFDQIIKAKAQKHINVENIAVKTIYQTAWIDDEGRLQIRDDVYGKYKNFKLAMSKKQTKLISAISPAPASYGSGVKMDKLAFAVTPNAAKL